MTMKLIRVYSLLLISATSVFGTSQAADEPKEIHFGSVAMDIPAIMHRRLTPLMDYLSKELGIPVTLKLSPNMPGAVEDLVAGNVDLAYLTPVAYIDTHIKAKTQLVVKTITAGEDSFKLMIVVKEDSPIKQVQDLQGKTFAFGDKAALLQRAAVVGAGIKLEQLGKYEFIGHYDNIARGIMAGDFDAGILKDTTAYKFQGKGLRIIHTSPALPPYNIAAGANVNKELLEKIRNAFLKLDNKNDAHKDIIKALDEKYDGFANTNDKEYDVVRTLIKPFEKP